MTQVNEAGLEAEARIAAYANVDGAADRMVLLAVLGCANSWVPEARIIGNVRAGDIQRAIRAYLSSTAPDEAGALTEVEWGMVRRGDMLGSRLGAKVATLIESQSATIRGLREALEPFARVARRIPPDKHDKEVTRVVMDEVLTAEEMAAFELRGAPVRSPQVEMILSLDGLSAKHFRRLLAALGEHHG